MVATGYHPEENAALSGQHVNIPLMVFTQIKVFDEAGELEETLACN